MGLFWSLRAAPGQKSGLFLKKRDARIPYVVNLSVVPEHLAADFIDTDQCKALDSTTIYRLYAAPDITGFDVHCGQLRGRLYLPPG